MKILHTADIHLKEKGDDRWITLKKLLELGRKKKIGIFIISGDLFDKNADAAKLRPEIRDIFSNNGFKIIIIPGNHDENSFRSGLHFGEDAVILNEPFKSFEIDELRIVGLPFEHTGGKNILDVITANKSRLNRDKKNILLCHGELLDSFFSRNDFGEEGAERYMPFWLHYFNDLNLDYVLAGHFHTRFDVRVFADRGYFVYPGSPVSITKKEIGQRKVNLFELGQPPAECPIDSPHYVELSLTLDPFEMKNPLLILKDYLKDLNSQAKLILTIQGFCDAKAIKTSELELQRKIKDIVGEKLEELHFAVRDVQEIIDDGLFKAFQRKVEESKLQPRRKKELVDITIKAMIEAKS